MDHLSPLLHVETAKVTCRYPARTGAYKALKQRFNKGEIHGYGYEIIEHEKTTI
jgi:hypothetical protein